MPVGGATDSQGRASLNVWSVQCQGHGRRQYRTEHKRSSYVFNDGHVLHLRSEIAALRRWINMVLDYYDGQMIPEGECGPHFLALSYNLGKASTRKLTQPGIDPEPAV